MARIQRHLQLLLCTGACLVDDKENTCQTKLAQAGGISVVTLRKRFLDITQLFPEIQKVTRR
jgi:hypothetical protein